QSSLLAAYPLLTGAAALRFRTSLVWFVTGLSMAGYLALAVHAHFWRPEVAAEPYRSFIFLLSLGMTGLIFHLLLRRVRQPASGGPGAAATPLLRGRAVGLARRGAGASAGRGAGGSAARHGHRTVTGLARMQTAAPIRDRARWRAAAVLALAAALFFARLGGR